MSVAGGGDYLFDPEELALRPSGAGRLRALARARKPALREHERGLIEDRAALRRLLDVAADLLPRFDLPAPRIEAEAAGVTAHYGICYADGTIRIRLRHATTGRQLKPSSLVDTLCHELAHLRYMDHGLRFRRLYARILTAARELGYYRPGPGEDSPRQGSLFDGTGCGAVRRA